MFREKIDDAEVEFISAGGGGGKRNGCANGKVKRTPTMFCTALPRANLFACLCTVKR